MVKLTLMGQTIKAVFIDMDNTLLRTQQLYEDAHEELAVMIGARTGIPGPVVIEETRKREIGLFPVHGYGKEMLPAAFAETLLHYIPDATPEDVLAARGIANNVYACEAEVKKGAEDAILIMARHVPVYLLTAGDDEVQQARVEKLPFKDKFSGIYIVPEKDPALYTRILAKHGLQPSEAVMIGDSLKSDIVSPVAAGMSAVYIPDQNWAAREQAGQELPAERARQVNNITEAVVYLLPQITDTANEAKPAPRRRAGGPAP